MAAKGQKPLKIEDPLPPDAELDAPVDLSDAATAPTDESNARPAKQQAAKAPGPDERELDKLAADSAQANKDADFKYAMRRVGALASLGRQNPNQIDTSDIDAARKAPLEMYAKRQEAKKQAAEQALQAAQGRHLDTESELAPKKYAEDVRHHKAETQAKQEETQARIEGTHEDVQARLQAAHEDVQARLAEITARMREAKDAREEATLQRQAEAEVGKWKDQSKAIEQSQVIRDYVSGKKKIPEWDATLLARENEAVDPHPGLLGKGLRAVAPVEHARSPEQNQYMADVMGARNELLHAAYGSRLTATEIAQKAKEYHLDPSYSAAERKKGMTQLLRDVEGELGTQSAKLSERARQRLEAGGAKIYEPRSNGTSRKPAESGPATPQHGDTRINPETGKKQVWVPD